MEKQRFETIALTHLVQGHKLYRLPGRSPNGIFNEGRIVRVWEQRPAGFYDFLKKQKNLKRMCPVCNPNAYKWEAKWNPETKPTVVSDVQNLDL